MAAPQNFRSAFNGFHKEDVVQYLEYINSKHNNEINQLSSEVAELRQQLEAKSQADPEQIALIEALQQERDSYRDQLQTAEAARKELEEQLSQLKAQQETAPAQKAPESPTLASDELEAYRRAERAEREAKERAELVYYQANGVLSEATGKVDTIAGEITEMADHVMSQLTQLQMLVSSSKAALQDASSLLGTIRPNK